MEPVENALPAAGQTSCAQNGQKTAVSRPEADGRDRRMLAGAAVWCVLAADCLWQLPAGAGLTALVWGWYALALAYLGRGCLRRGECRALLAANLALGLTFALTSDGDFRVWNFLALAALMPIHAAALSGAGRRPWHDAAMLRERLALAARGAFASLGVLPSALAGAGRSRRRVLSAALGAALALACVAALLPVLGSADALFASVTASFQAFLRRNLPDWAGKVLAGLCLTPFAFSLLCTLRRPPERKPLPPARQAAGEPLTFGLLLAGLCGLYAFFLAVQLRGLLGGGAYLAARGISYAQWARSGFFQMVGVTAMNLAAVLLALRWSRASRAVRGLSVLLIAESAALLVSAARRMTLYVGAYGLSFLRVMTCWGMAMMAVFLLAGLLAALRPGFPFCKMAFAAALAGWLIINCVPVDYLTARNLADRGRAGVQQTDLCYLTECLSYDALGPASELAGTPEARDYAARRGETLEQAVARRRAEARAECARWESWNLSAYLASR